MSSKEIIQRLPVQTLLGKAQTTLPLQGRLQGASHPVIVCREVQELQNNSCLALAAAQPHTLSLKHNTLPQEHSRFANRRCTASKLGHINAFAIKQCNLKYVPEDHHHPAVLQKT